MEANVKQNLGLAFFNEITFNKIMKHLFITGASSGIGKALAEYALSKGDKVTGISRRHTINHKNYSHIHMDLSEHSDLGKINFVPVKEADTAVLVNNAGWLGDVRPVAEMDPDKIARAFSINVTAPAILSRMFLGHLKNQGENLTKVVLNISSGVSRYPLSSWSTYCASKAALDMFTKVLKVDHPEVHAFSVAPGIVDTEMQGEIRRLTVEHFPDKDRFVEYKEKGELSQPKDVALNLYNVMDQPSDYKEVCFSLKDM